MKNRYLFFLLISFSVSVASVGSNHLNLCYAENEYRLQFNLARNNQGEWVDNCAYMNYGEDTLDWNYELTTCYPYAIERAILESYGEYCYYSCIPGSLDLTNHSCSWQTVEDVVELVVIDLTSLHYEVSYSTNMPLHLNEGESLICVRTTTNPGGDFHFMRYEMIDGEYCWTQKFAESAPLLYLYEPEEMPWSVEKAWGTGCSGGDFELYTSQVYYITYGHSIFSYSEDNDVVEIDSINISQTSQNLGSLLIPENINGKPVISIGNNAFSSLNNLEAIFIPELYTPISFGSNVFSSINHDFKIFVPESQLSYYQNQINLYPYLDKIVPYYFDTTGTPAYITQETLSFEGDEIGEWTTYYDDDNYYNGVSSGFLIEDELFIVTVLNSYYAYCSFNDIELDDIINVVLRISLDSFSEGMEVFLLDENASYVDTYEVINGYLEINLTSLINDEMSSFALYPANSNTNISFLPEDVEMFTTFNTIVEIEL